MEGDPINYHGHYASYHPDAPHHFHCHIVWHAVYSVTLSVWTLPQCNGIIEWPITDVLRSDESISKTVPLCPYGGPIQGAIDAVAQGQRVP